MKKREEIYKLDVKDRKREIRQKDKEDKMWREQQRKQDNMHNFTNSSIGKNLKTFLDRGGGYVPICSKTHCTLRNRRPISRFIRA